MNTSELLEKIAFNVIQGRVEAEDDGFDPGLEGRPAVTELVTEALDKNIDPKKILMESLTESMETVGDKFEKKGNLELALNATLNTTARILQPSLLDFLR